MIRNRLWIAFLALFGVITAVFTAIAMYKLADYYRTPAATVATASRWSTDKIGGDRFALRVRYQYRIGEKEFEGEDQIKWPTFRSTAAASAAIQELEKVSPRVWYRPASPHASTVQRKFPSRPCVHAGLLLGTMAYLLILGAYIARQSVLVGSGEQHPA